MVGDSFQNDMVGAKNVGMDVCYYNYKNKKIEMEGICDFVINNIKELETMLTERDI